MTMRTRLTVAVRGPGAMCRVSAEDAEDIVDGVLDVLMDPTEAMFSGLHNADIDLKNEWPMSRGIFRSMIRAARDGA